MKRDRPVCDDCGDEVPRGKRRRRCGDCGQLVCPWCLYHVHARSLLAQLRRERAAR